MKEKKSYVYYLKKGKINKSEEPLMAYFIKNCGSCGDDVCPFNSVSELGYSCGLQPAALEVGFSDALFATCPLKKNDIIATLSTQI